MSEEQIQEALGQQNELDQEVVDQVVEQEEQHQEEQPDLSAVEQRAWDQGWRPEEQFEGNPDNWKSADSYILYGEMQEQIREVKNDSRRKEREFDDRIANLNKIHEGQKAAAIADLMAQQRTAVSEADTEEFDRIQKQIDGHKTVDPTPATPYKDPAIEEWEERNSWINDPDSEKAQQAQAFWNIAVAKPGATPKSALDYVDQQLAKLYPEEQAPVNHRREMPTMTEQSRKPAGRTRSKELTMNDLTRDEQTQWQQFGKAMFGDEKSYLKAVSDARKA